MTRRDEGRNAFDNLTDAAVEIYGLSDTESVTSGKRIRVTRIPIDELSPDQQQPRRVIPAAIAAQAPGNRVAQLMAWHAATGKIHVAAMLREEQPIPDDADTPLLLEWLKLIRFAVSVKPGLTNPITVAPLNSQLTIETGERRWTAHVLLNAFDVVHDGNDFSTIATRRFEDFSRERQATENTNRSDLNAVGMARQLALAIMESYRDDKSVTFEPMAAFDHERDFYAQVANMQAKYGNAALVKRMMGGRGSSVLSDYKDLLALTSQQWDEADKDSTSLNKLMLLVNPAKHKTNAANAPSHETSAMAEIYPTQPDSPTTLAEADAAIFDDGPPPAHVRDRDPGPRAPLDARPTPPPRAADPGPRQPVNPPLSDPPRSHNPFVVGQRVTARGFGPGVVARTEGFAVDVDMDDDQRRCFNMHDLTPYADPTPDNSRYIREATHQAVRLDDATREHLDYLYNLARLLNAPQLAGAIEAIAENGGEHVLTRDLVAASFQAMHAELRRVFDLTIANLSIHEED